MSFITRVTSVESYWPLLLILHKCSGLRSASDDDDDVIILKKRTANALLLPVNNAPEQHHSVTTTTTTEFQCPYYARLCAPRVGLQGFLKSPRMRPQQSSSLATEGLPQLSLSWNKIKFAPLKDDEIDKMQLNRAWTSQKSQTSYTDQLCKVFEPETLERH